MLQWADESIQKCVNQKICSWNQKYFINFGLQKTYVFQKTLTLMTDYDN